MATRLTIAGITRRFGRVKALDSVDLEINAGEFFTLLGSSGSGKSTLLKIIGGFDQPDSGVVQFDGRDVTNVPPNKRPCNTVFQDLALFPHMSVAENVGYGLVLRRVPKDERDRQIAEALALVNLAGFEDRNVNLLSGGQRQRVALARALIMEPGVLLLDEPLTGLDERLRQQMRDEFGRLHARTGATFILVTHNQDEALSLSDRMAIMHNGCIEQVGHPREIFEQPQNCFVARFVGMDNIIRPHRIEQNGKDARAWIGDDCFAVRKCGDRTRFVVAARPDQLRLAPAKEPASLPATVCGVRYRGSTYDVEMRLADGQLVLAWVDADTAPPECGATVGINFVAGGPVPVDSADADNGSENNKSRVNMEVTT